MLAEALFCLALNAYWEARNQDMEGMIAVSQVVVNRVESEYYPDDICDVVYQGPTRPSWKNKNVEYPVRHRCQFSWYCDGKSDNIPDGDEEAWEMARLAAFGVYFNKVENKVGDALWYHADYVTPGWADHKQETARIGNHIFYEWKNGTQ